MKRKAARQAVEVAGAKDVLFDFRAPDVEDGTAGLDAQAQASIFKAVFGTRRNVDDGDSAEDCEGERAKCFAADRAAGRISLEVLDAAAGSFTQPGAQQVAYLIALNEEHAGHVDNFGAKRLAVFEGSRLVLNKEVGDYCEI